MLVFHRQNYVCCAQYPVCHHLWSDPTEEEAHGEGKEQGAELQETRLQAQVKQFSFQKTLLFILENDDTVICQFCFRIYFGDKRLHAF